MFRVYRISKQDGPEWVSLYGTCIETDGAVNLFNNAREAYPDSAWILLIDANGLIMAAEIGKRKGAF
jgi:hypothetical protein